MKIPKPTNKTIYLLAAGIVIGAIIMSSVYEFFDRYMIVSPIQPRIVSPIPHNSGVKVITPTEALPTTTPKPKKLTKAEIVATSKYPDFIDHIWERESTRGQNKTGLNLYCLEKNMSNEMGFYPTGKHCFTDFEASVRRLEKWYEDNIELTDNQKLCRYNSGVASDTCPYLSYNFQDMN